MTSAIKSDEQLQLSEGQMTFFAQNGYLILRGLLNEHEQADLISWTAEVKEWPNTPGAHMPYEEIDKYGRRFLTRTENYANFHDGFNALLRGTRLRCMLAQLSGEEMVLFKEKINYKAPGGGGFDPHTDSPAYQHIAALKHLTILIAVEPATAENGYLEVVAGSHLIRDIPLNKDHTIKKEWEDGHEWVPVPLDTGDMLIFGSFLAHRSGPNNSPHGRAAIYATYNAMSEGGDQHDDYYAHRRKIWPPTFEREPGKRYKEGFDLYAWGTPMTTVETAV
ncbi:PhyH-domain-containing protein [Dacryopinax primogenitus]|uniref:PhyH-domain-containing protein n=1 Tax=Dacryopinax primogenitus (strain DJM 731) TaxID=1858805 RepID=M5FTV2_DACPD|nr:PhyH-domain-containing protein [Dacryopinax primogenitus]EJT96646.1 PhyH-domain-containing protein [Dacryopinax primogenitus]